MIFTLRPMAYADIEWLRQLRNANAEHFFDHREITPEAQEAWWRAAQYGDERWIIERPLNGGKQSVGYFSIVAPKHDLPIFPTDGRPVRYFSTMVVDERYRGEGAVLAAASVFDTVSTCYVGYVAEGNHASLRACEKLGFVNRGRYKHGEYGYIWIVWRDK